MNNDCLDNTRIPVQRGLLAGLLLCLMGIIGVVPCHAQQSTNWALYNNWEMTAFKVEGLPSQWKGELTKGLALTGQWKLLSGTKRPPFSSALLAADLERIRLFLATRGYPAARVIPAVVLSPDSRQLALTVTVVPGDPVRIAEVNFLGWPAGLAFPDTANSRILTQEQIVVDEAIGEGLAAVLLYLQNSGYALSQVTLEVLPAGPFRVNVNFRIEAGDFYIFDEIVVTGCSDDLIPLAHRMINISPGTEYAEERVENASLDLRLTQLFRHVNLTTEEISPGHLRFNAELENGRMRTWDAAIGTWSDNPWMVRSSWTHRNLFDRGRGFTARGSFATHEFNLGVGVFWLGWGSPRARTRVGFDVIANREDAYESEEYRVEIVQSFRPRKRDILNVGSALSESQIVEFAPSSDNPESQGRLWEVWVDRKWDWTNDPLFPSKGGFLKLSLTFAEPWVFSEVPYAGGQVDATKYVDLPLGMILTGRVRMGLAVPLTEGTEILANRRFYAGGYNSHRGYERHGLGPRDEEGNPRGGEAVMLLSAEVRVPLVWILEGGLFVDSGNVWGTGDEFTADDFPIAIGATIGLRSPLGPLRVGYAINVEDRLAWQPRDLWHFGIGYPW